jgi:hypothetical protein
LGTRDEFRDLDSAARVTVYLVEELKEVVRDGVGESHLLAVSEGKTMNRKPRHLDRKPPLPMGESFGQGQMTQLVPMDIFPFRPSI